MYFETRPENFEPDIEAAGCFIEKDGEVLMLRRAPGKLQGGLFGQPGGKLDVGESPEEALKREVMEETGIAISGENLRYVGHVFGEQDNRRFIYHIFHWLISNQSITVTINPEEHTEFRWIKPKDLLEMEPELMEDEIPCVKIAFKL